MSETTLLTQAATPPEGAETAPVADVVTETQHVTTTPVVDDWRPEPLRGERALEKYKSQEDALKALVEAQKLIGKKADPLAPPAEDAPQEEKDAFHAKLRELRGVPAADKVAEAYAVAPPENAPEGYALNEELVSAFQGLALEAGLAPAEFKKLADGYIGLELAHMAKSRADSAARQEKAEADLVGEWQKAGKTPKDMFTQALKGAQALGLVEKDGTTSVLGHLGNNTALVKALAENVYPLIAEGGVLGGGREESGPTYTPKEALDKLRGMASDQRYQKKDPDFLREYDAFAERYGKTIRELTKR